MSRLSRRLRRATARAIWKTVPKLEVVGPIKAGDWIETDKGQRVVAYVDEKTRRLITYKPAWHQVLRKWIREKAEVCRARFLRAA
jgi:hypothetical protein